VFPTLLLVLGGILDLGLLFQRYEVVTNAAREGARVSILSGVTALPAYNNGNVTSRVNAYLTAAGLTGTSTVNVGAVQSVAVGGGHCIKVRQVTVTYDSQLIFLGPIFHLMGGGNTKTIRATSAMRIEMAAEGC